MLVVLYLSRVCIANINRTGVSGYIGGDLLSVLAVQYPDYQYRVLVRSEKSRELIKAQFLGIEIILADLDDLETLARESARADIIIRMSHTACRYLLSTF